MGDYNVEVTESSMQEFRESYFLENMVKKPTWFKNHAQPTCVDLIIRNKPGMFQNAKTYEAGLSDFHKLVVNTMKLTHKKKPPLIIKYRDIKFKSILKIPYIKNLPIIPSQIIMVFKKYF